MNASFYATLAQLVPDGIPVLHTDNKKVEIMLGARWDLWDPNAAVAQPGRISLCMLKAPRVPFLKVTKFHREHGRLDRVKARVRSHNQMNVLCRATVVS